VTASTNQRMAPRRWLKAWRHGSQHPEMLAVALVFIMVGAACVTVWDLYRRATVETRISLAKLTRGVAEQTHRSFRQVDLVLTDIVEFIDQAGYDASSMNGRISHRYLADRIRGLRQVGDLMIADEAGRIVNHALSWPAPDVDISAREQFRLLRYSASDFVVVSAPERNEIDDSWTLYLARRLSGPNGEFKGIAQAAVRLADFEQFYEALVPGEGTAITLLRQDGMRLARFPATRHIGGLVADGSKIQSGGEIETTDPDGTMMSVSMYPVRDFPLAVAVAMTDQAVLSLWGRDAAIMLVGASAAVAAVVLMLLLQHKLREYRNRISRELDAARLMQLELLPSMATQEAVADCGGLRIASYFQPSSEIGGDIWGILPINERCIGVFIADFTGHGVTAALNTFRLHALIHEYKHLHQDPVALLSALNRRLAALLSIGQFASFLYVVIDYNGDRLSVASAGSPPPILMTDMGGPAQLVEAVGVPLGILRDTPYQLYERSFLPGARLLLFSDGLPENPNHHGYRIGEVGLLGALNSCAADLTPSQIVTQICKAASIGADNRLADDTTVICIDRRGNVAAGSVKDGFGAGCEPLHSKTELREVMV